MSFLGGVYLEVILVWLNIEAALTALVGSNATHCWLWNHVSGPLRHINDSVGNMN